MGHKEWSWLREVLDPGGYIRFLGIPQTFESTYTSEHEVYALKGEVLDLCQKVVDLGRELRRSQEERTWLSWELALLQKDSDRLRHSIKCLKAQVPA